MQREQKPKVGERVRILSGGTDDVIGKIATVTQVERKGGCFEMEVRHDDGEFELFDYNNVEAVHPLPTDAQKLRDAAEVVMSVPRELQRGDDIGISNALISRAIALEAASAPKPPSLREAAQAVADGMRLHLDGRDAELMAALRAALSREEG